LKHRNAFIFVAVFCVQFQRRFSEHVECKRLIMRLFATNTHFIRRRMTLYKLNDEWRVYVVTASSDTDLGNVRSIDGSLTVCGRPIIQHRAIMLRRSVSAQQLVCRSLGPFNQSTTVATQCVCTAALTASTARCRPPGARSVDGRNTSLWPSHSARRIVSALLASYCTVHRQTGGQAFTKQLDNVYTYQYESRERISAVSCCQQVYRPSFS